MSGIPQVACMDSDKSGACDKTNSTHEDNQTKAAPPPKCIELARGANETALLSVPDLGVYRSPSPTLSNISVQDFLLHGAEVSSGPSHFTTNWALGSWRARLNAYWCRNKGLILVLISQLFGSLMTVATKLLEQESGLHPFQILFARMSITAVISMMYMYYMNIPDFLLGPRGVRALLVARGVGGFFGVFGLYYSLQYLPLSDAIVITFLAPGLSCWVCSFLIQEPFTRTEQIAALISLLGVVLIARPTSLFASFNDGCCEDAQSAAVTNATIAASPSHSPGDITPSQRLSAVGFAMLGVFGAVCAYVTIRWIGKRAHALISVNYFAVWCTLVSTVMLLILPNVGFVLPKNPREWTLLAFLGVCGWAMQFLMSMGLQYERSSRGTMMVYVSMLFALAFDKVIFGITPGLLSVMGSSLIMGSAIYVALQKVNIEKQPTPLDAAAYGDEERGITYGARVGTAEDYGSGDDDMQMRPLRP